MAAALGPERFLREIKIAAQLHHPHILPLHDSGEADGFLYYVMLYEEGQSLRQRLAKEGELPVTEAVRLLRVVVDALAHAHQHGVVHRDIKPDNVMLSGRHALVTDFGIAKAVSEAIGRQELTTVRRGSGDTGLHGTGTSGCRSAHRPPGGHLCGGRSCLRTIGGTPALHRHHAADGALGARNRSAESITKYRESVPPALAQLVMKCLEKKPADRWQSADDLLTQLEALATPSGGTVPVRGVSSALSKRRLQIAAVAGLLIVVAAGAWAWLRPGGSSTLDPDLVAVAPFDVRRGA